MEDGGIYDETWVMPSQYAESRESQVNCNTGPIVTSYVTLPHLVQAGFILWSCLRKEIKLEISPAIVQAMAIVKAILIVNGLWRKYKVASVTRIHEAMIMIMPGY